MASDWLPYHDRGQLVGEENALASSHWLLIRKVAADWLPYHDWGQLVREENALASSHWLRWQLIGCLTMTGASS